MPSQRWGWRVGGRWGWTHKPTRDETVVKHTLTIYIPCHKRIEIRMKQLIKFSVKLVIGRYLWKN